MEKVRYPFRRCDSSMVTFVTFEKGLPFLTASANCFNDSSGPSARISTRPSSRFFTQLSYLMSVGFHLDEVAKTYALNPAVCNHMILKHGKTTFFLL